MKRRNANLPRLQVKKERIYCVDLSIDGPDDPGIVTGDEGGPTIWFPVMRPIDLTDSHGVDITEERLAEMAAAYDPNVEQASMNFDHAYGGPSLGWCQEMEVREDGYLWALYGDLADLAVEAIRTKRYPRRSAEFVISHPTGGWYFTGLALIGNARPAIPGMPPVELYRPCYVINLTEEKPVKPKEKPTKTPPPPPAEPENPNAPEEEEQREEPESEEGETAPAVSAAELKELRSGIKLAGELRSKNANLEAKSFLDGLGAKITPAIRRLAEPLLEQLLAATQPAVVKLAAKDGKTTEVTVVKVLQQLLEALPDFKALGMGEIAKDDPPPLNDPSGRLSAERLRELESKYHFTRSQGFTSN